MVSSLSCPAWPFALEDSQDLPRAVGLSLNRFLQRELLKAAQLLQSVRGSLQASPACKGTVESRSYNQTFAWRP